MRLARSLNHVGTRWCPPTFRVAMCSPKLCTTFTEGMLARDWNRIEGNWKLKGKIKEK
jgi:hypothetical protein